MGRGSLGLHIEVLAQEQVLEGLVLAKCRHQGQEVRVEPWSVDGTGLALRPEGLLGSPQGFFPLFKEVPLLTIV